MIEAIRQLRADGRVVSTRQCSARLVITPKCPWRCTFCHHEGTGCTSHDIHINAELYKLLETIQERLGYTEVHLTGGEPTSHQDLGSIVQMCAGLGFKVKLTTNGQVDKQTLLRIIDHGLSGVNLSIHTLEPVVLAQLQAPTATVSWATRQIANQTACIDSLSSLARYGIDIKVNTVVANEYQNAIKVFEFCRTRPWLRWRAMNELSAGQVAYDTLGEMIKRLGGRYIEYSHTNGSSSCAVMVELPDGYRFHVKMIQPFHLNCICGTCAVRKAGLCYEGIYGIRVEQREERLAIRLCIHRNDHAVVMGIGEFINSDAYDELTRETERSNTDVG